MSRDRRIASLLILLSVLAAGSLTWGIWKGLVDSADLERRVEEADLFARRMDPYQDDDMTYPPSAPPVFLVLIAPVRGSLVRPAWIAGNLLALSVFCHAVVKRWGTDWPGWAKLAFCLIACAAKPTRGGMALGQFHLIPLALLAVALTWEHSGSTIIPGILVGLALIKPTMIGPVLFVLAFRRFWTLLAVAGLTQFALTVTTSVWVHTSPLTLTKEWLRNARGQVAMGTIDVPSLAIRFFSQFVPDASRISLGILLFSAVLIWMLRKKSELGLFSLGCLLAAMFTYHRPYDLVLLLPAFAYFFRRCIREPGSGNVLCAILAAALLIIPTPGRPNSLAAQTYDAVFVVGSYAGLLWLVILLIREPGETTSFEPTGSSISSHRCR